MDLAVVASPPKTGMTEAQAFLARMSAYSPYSQHSAPQLGAQQPVYTPSRQLSGGSSSVGDSTCQGYYTSPSSPVGPGYSSHEGSASRLQCYSWESNPSLNARKVVSEPALFVTTLQVNEPCPVIITQAKALRQYVHDAAKAGRSLDLKVLRQEFTECSQLIHPSHGIELFEQIASEKEELEAGCEVHLLALDITILRGLLDILTTSWSGCKKDFMTHLVAFIPSPWVKMRKEDFNVCLGAQLKYAFSNNLIECYGALIDQAKQQRSVVALEVLTSRLLEDINVMRVLTTKTARSRVKLRGQLRVLKPFSLNNSTIAQNLDILVKQV